MGQRSRTSRDIFDGQETGDLEPIHYEGNFTKDHLKKLITDSPTPLVGETPTFAQHNNYQNKHRKSKDEYDLDTNTASRYDDMQQHQLGDFGINPYKAQQLPNGEYGVPKVFQGAQKSVEHEHHHHHHHHNEYKEAEKKHYINEEK